MDILILVLILVGAANMLHNIIVYIIFMSKMRDVISGGVKRDTVLMYIGLILIIFFLGGYIYVGFFANPHLVTAFIMFFGSLFVSLVLLLMIQLIKTSKERSLEIAQILISVIDARGSLQGHSLHVKNLMMVFLKHLPRYMKTEFSPVSIEFAALLHDIGNLGVPEEILEKNGDLTPEEWEKMRTHPQVGVRLLRPVKSFDYISDWILYHHERIDGNGYYFKKGDSIPLPSKMLAIADAYSAMVLGRVYNPPKTHSEALEELKKEAGTQFDEELVEIFISIPEKEVTACIPEEVQY
ncbi:MAG: HD domain-containing protein [Erysipelotrichaceae bacterium]|nr:HD domain-containing protein [Erysipelotrichaceae bacterium]